MKQGATLIATYYYDYKGVGCGYKARWIDMLTLEEILSDVAISPGFKSLENVGINSRGDNGETPLHWMATLGDVPALRLLIASGSDINAADDDGNTPLHEAVVWRQALAVGLLIQQGADVNFRNKAGLTPGDLAKSDGFAPVVQAFP